MLRRRQRTHSQGKRPDRPAPKWGEGYHQRLRQTQSHEPKRKETGALSQSPQGRGLMEQFGLRKGGYHHSRHLQNHFRAHFLASYRQRFGCQDGRTVCRRSKLIIGEEE